MRRPEPRAQGEGVVEGKEWAGENGEDDLRNPWEACCVCLLVEVEVERGVECLDVWTWRWCRLGKKEGRTEERKVSK
jgi:hypothetical protein